MQIQLVETAEELGRLESQWNALVAASDMDNPFLQWEWCSAWWRHYGAGHDLAIVLLRDAGELVGLAPLYMEHGRGLLSGVMQFLGTGEVCSEYLGFVFRRGREAEGTRVLLDYLMRQTLTPWRLLRLAELPEDAAATPLIDSYLASSDLPYRTERSGTTWFIELTNSWEGFLERVSRNRREKFRRARRDMEKFGLEFHEVSSEEEIDSVWEELRRLHQLRWQRRGEPGCFASPRFTAFHGELLRPLLRRGILSLTALRHGKKTLAASYCLRHRGRVCFYQGGVDPDWMECRPGHTLRVCELRRAIERGDRFYDFLRGDMEYKQQWATHQAALVQFSIPAFGVVPRAQFRLENAARWVKQSARECCSPEAWGTLRRWKQRLTKRQSPKSHRTKAESAEVSQPVPV